MNDSISFGEILYYFQCRIKGLLSTLAAISIYSPPLPSLLIKSHGTFASCKYFGDNNLSIIDVTCIKAVVAMIPHSPPGVESEDKYFYLVERPGLDIANLGSNIQEVFNEES